MQHESMGNADQAASSLETFDRAQVLTVVWLLKNKLLLESFRIKLRSTFNSS